MAWINSASVGALTLLGVAVMGFVPTSAGLVDATDLPCRAVLAPISGADLRDGLSDGQRQVVEAWLSARATESVDAAEAAQAGTLAADLCGEAQRTRAVWMILAAVFGTATAFGLRGWGTPSDTSAPTGTATSGSES